MSNLLVLLEENQIFYNEYFVTDQKTSYISDKSRLQPKT